MVNGYNLLLPGEYPMKKAREKLTKKEHRKLVMIDNNNNICVVTYQDLEIILNIKRTKVYKVCRYWRAIKNNTKLNGDFYKKSLYGYIFVYLEDYDENINYLEELHKRKTPDKKIYGDWNNIKWKRKYWNMRDKCKRENKKFDIRLVESI